MRNRIKHIINGLLGFFDLKLEGTQRDQAERNHLQGLVRTGHFDHPVFPVPMQFENMDISPVLTEIDKQADRFSNFLSPDDNATGYTFDNDYFSSPDAEVLYAMVCLYRPTRIVEVGSGNSTRLFRLAIEDNRLATRLVSIDPSPRVEVESHADQLYRMPVEALTDCQVFTDLRAGDILFIDSSHELKAGNDVARLYCEILPQLADGVIIHIHDIFLPWEYLKEWIVDNGWNWNEQYVVQVLLQQPHYEVLWAGYYLQHTHADFDHHFPHRAGRSAQSLWLRVKATKMAGET